MVADQHRTECPACGRNSWTADRVASDILAVGSSRNVEQCSHCGLRRLWPYLSDTELTDLYRGGYFGDQVDSAGLDGVANVDVAYETLHGAERAGKFQRIVQRLISMNPRARTFLDIGAATGALVSAARTAGLEADGVEFSAHAVAAAQHEYGLELYQGGVEAIPDKVYDFVVLHHVLEHLTTPLEDLRRIKEHVAPGGMLYIEIPFQFHLIEKAKFRLSSHDEPRSPTLLSFHHPYFYTPRSLRLLLERAGFDIMSVRCFVPDDYAARTAGDRVKKVLWKTLDRTSGVGNVIEALARG